MKSEVQMDDVLDVILKNGNSTGSGAGTREKSGSRSRGKH